MVGWIIVMTPADYSQWISTSVVAGRSLADLGAGLYHRYGCDTCHETGKGPSLRGLYGSRVKVTKGLEWTTASPPPTENFEVTPIVTEEAYAYIANVGRDG